MGRVCSVTDEQTGASGWLLTVYLILQVRGEPVQRRDRSSNPPAVQPDRTVQKLQNDNGCKSLHLMIFTFLVARGFGSRLRVSEFHWKRGVTTLKGHSKAGDDSRILLASFLPRT